MFNSVSLIGNLGKDPELRQGNETAAASFNIAVNENFTDKAGEKQKRTHWFRVVAYGKLAEICQKYLHSGSKVALRGQLTNRTWEDNKGAKHSIVEINARKIEFLDSANGSGNANGKGCSSEDDMPF